MVTLGVVLAGGKGTRLGRVCKPMIRRSDGCSLLEAACQALGPVVDHGVVCAPDGQLRTFGELPSGWSGLADPGQGPAHALHSIPAGPDLVVWSPADVPWPHPEVATRLLAALRPENDAVAPVWDGVLQAGHAVMRHRAFPKEPPRSLQGLLRSARLRSVSVQAWPPHVLRGLQDIDDPEDLQLIGDGPCPRVGRSR